MSDPLDIHKAISEIFARATPGSRFDHQKAVERAITDFRPDFIEAEEILQALQVSLERRYEQDISDILHEMKQLREALQEADSTQQLEHDEWMRVNDEQA